MNSIFIFLGILFFTFILSLFRYNQTENVTALLYLLRLTTYFTFLAYFWFLLKSEKNIIDFLKIPLLIFIMVTIVASILQYFLYPDLRNLYYLGWDPHLYRVFGTFFEPVISASIFGLFLIFIFFNRTYLGQRIITNTLLVVLSVLLFLTYTRSGILALFAVAEFNLTKKNIFYAFLIVMTVIFLLFLLPKKSGEGVNLFRTTSISARAIDIEQGLQLAAKNPVFGIGYNHIRYEKHAPVEDHAAAGFHSSFLIILVTSGILGLLSYIYLLYQIGRVNLTAAFSIIFLSIMSLFDNVLLHPFVLFLLFILIPLSILSRNER